MLESPPPPQIGRGFGRVRGGGTGAAAQRLANALSVLDRDVEAAGMLVDDGASLRCCESPLFLLSSFLTGSIASLFLSYNDFSNPTYFLSTFSQVPLFFVTLIRGRV